MEIKKTQIGFTGALLLILGTLVPIVTIPIAGSQNYFQNGTGDGVFIVALALLAIVLIVTKKFQALIAVGIASAALTSFTLVSILIRISEAKSELEASLEGNPFAGLATGLMNSVQIEWGWLVLYLGAAALVASGIMARKEKAVTEVPPTTEE
jgi:hypothetical protein